MFERELVRACLFSTLKGEVDALLDSDLGTATALDDGVTP